MFDKLLAILTIRKRRNRLMASSTGEDGGSFGALAFAVGLAQLLWRAVCQFLVQLNMDLPCDLAIPFLDVYPRDEKVCSPRGLHRFIAALFIIIKS